MGLEGLAVALLGQGAGAEGSQQGGAHAGDSTPLLTHSFMLYHNQNYSCSHTDRGSKVPTTQPKMQDRETLRRSDTILANILHREPHKHCCVTLRSLTAGGGKSEWETRHLRLTCVRATKSGKHGCSDLTRRAMIMILSMILIIGYKYE